MSQVENAAE